MRTIEADAPAYKSDLRPFDVITQVDGAPVSTDTQLQREILKKKVGQNVELGVWRKGQTMKIAVTTGELPNEIAAARLTSRLRGTQPREEDIEQVWPAGAGIDQGSGDPAETERAAGRDRDRRGR